MRVHTPNHIPAEVSEWDRVILITQILSTRSEKVKSYQNSDTQQEDEPSDTGQHQGKDAVPGQIVTVPNLSKDSSQRPDYDRVDCEDMDVANEAIQDRILQEEVCDSDRSQEGEDESSDGIRVDPCSLLNHRAQAEEGCYGDPGSIEHQSTQHQEMGEPEIDFVFLLQNGAPLVHAHRDQPTGKVQHHSKQCDQSQGHLREIKPPREDQPDVESTGEHVAEVQYGRYGPRCLLPVDEAPSKQNPSTLEGVGNDPGRVRPHGRCDYRARALYRLLDGKVETEIRGVAPPGIQAEDYFGQEERGHQKERQRLANDLCAGRLPLLVHMNATSLSEGQSTTPHSRDTAL